MKKIIILGMAILTLLFVACEKSSSSNTSNPTGATVFTNEEQELYSNYVDEMAANMVDYVSLENKVINDYTLEANYTIIKDVPDSELNAGDTGKEVIEKTDGIYYDLFYVNGKLKEEERLSFYSIRDLLYGYFYDEYEEVESFVSTLNNSGELTLLSLSSENLILDEWTINFGFEYNSTFIYFNYEVTKDGYIAKYNANEELEAKTIADLNSLVKEYLINWEKNQI